MLGVGILSDIKFSYLSAFLGCLLGLTVFAYNYTFITCSVPGYEVLTAPARLALSFFSEETAFWPKMLIFMLGQYLGYFLVIFFVKRLIAFFKR
ncbi:MAG: hypothetical protein ACPG52_02860 [Cognaticolwellia sp.]